MNNFYSLIDHFKEVVEAKLLQEYLKDPDKFVRFGKLVGYQNNPFKKSFYLGEKHIFTIDRSPTSTS